MKKGLVRCGHVAIDPCSVVLTINADLEPEPKTLAPGTVRITVTGGETIELSGRAAAAWWCHVERIAPDLERRVLVSHGQDVEPEGGAGAGEC